jgi:predicted O-methyltransferase YrrM
MSDYISQYFEKHYHQLTTREQWKSEDAEGNPIPWITYTALFQIEQFDFSSADIFEWGGGYSSLFWSERCKSINTVENDPEWVEFVRKKQCHNVTCHHVELKDYASYIDKFDHNFDVIVIDGYIHDGMRRMCAEYALSHLNEGGLLILDNSDWLAKTTQYLRENGFNQSDYYGFGPINNYPWCTSLFHNGQLALPRRSISPGFVPGGIKNVRD